MKAMFGILFMMVCTGLTFCCTAPSAIASDSVASGSQTAVPAAAAVFPALEAWLAENRLTINAGQDRVAEYDKAVAQGAVLAYGEGYPLAEAEGAGQKRLTALRAAEVTAQRNLAEYVARHATTDEIRFSTHSARQEAFLKGAYVVASEYNADSGKAAVLLRLDLDGAQGFAK